MSAVSVVNVVQPESFAFTAENAAKIPGIIAKYPAGKQQSVLDREVGKVIQDFGLSAAVAEGLDDDIDGYSRSSDDWLAT